MITSRWQTGRELPKVSSKARVRAGLDSLNEISLLYAARNDPACFAPIYDRYFGRVYAFCLRRTGSVQDAEDLTSQVFERAINGLATYRGGLVAAWLFRIARNVVANYYRDGHRRLTVDLDERLAPGQPESASPWEHVIHAERLRVVRTLVADLSPAERELLALRLSAGLNSSAIGELLEQKPATIRKRLQRIFKRLRAQLPEEWT